MDEAPAVGERWVKGPVPECEERGGWTPDARLGWAAHDPRCLIATVFEARDGRIVYERVRGGGDRVPSLLEDTIEAFLASGWQRP